ncbi:MAG: HpcH/HpaI aldolase family protein, partial [Chloroflexota bacterium]
MRANPALAKLRAGRVVSGPFLSYGSPDLAEQVAHLGFDWVALDWQHGQWTETTLNDALARFLAVDTIPLVRVKGHEPGTINRVLDMGAMGVIVPMVQNAEQARAAVQAARYPPLGLRSGGGVRLPLLSGSDSAAYFARANDEILLAAMVETREAIANVRTIMAVPGIDVVFIGPGDLMLDVKAGGHDEASHESLVQQVLAAARETGTPAGLPCPTREVAEQRIAQGFRFIHYGSDHGILMAGFREDLD